MAPPAKYDLHPGAKFGKLTLLEETRLPVGRRKSLEKHWRCLCDCGNEKVVKSSHMATRVVKSCGCLRRRKQVFPGRRFGCLTAVELVSPPGTHQQVWACRCDCENETRVFASNLAGGRTLSCGCGRRAGKGGRRQVGAVPAWLYGRSAKLSGFVASHEHLAEVWDRQGGRCAETGFPLAISASSWRDRKTTAALAKVDEAGGWADGNVRWVHRDVAKMMAGVGREQFVEVCRAVAQSAGTSTSTPYLTTP